MALYTVTIEPPDYTRAKEYYTVKLYKYGDYRGIVTCADTHWGAKLAAKRALKRAYKDHQKLSYQTSFPAKRYFYNFNTKSLDELK